MQPNKDFFVFDEYFYVEAESVQFGLVSHEGKCAFKPSYCINSEE